MAGDWGWGWLAGAGWLGLAGAGWGWLGLVGAGWGWLGLVGWVGWLGWLGAGGGEEVSQSSPAVSGRLQP